jgi:hypothetical protein
MTSMEIYQQVDGHSYNETLLEIALIKPDEVQTILSIVSTVETFCHCRYSYMMDGEGKQWLARFKRNSLIIVEFCLSVDK